MTKKIKHYTEVRQEHDDERLAQFGAMVLAFMQTDQWGRINCLMAIEEAAQDLDLLPFQD
jgi:hypothetical protein